MPTSFETFINNELPLRVSTLDAPVSGDIPVFTGVGKLTEAKSTSELGLATTSYVDTAVTKVWKDQGDYNVSGGTAWPTSANTIGAVAIKAGNLWVVAGAATNGTTLTGGKIVSNGDTIRALVDNATNAGADWGVNEANLGYTPENQSNKDSDGTLSANSDTKYPTQKAVKTYADTKQLGRMRSDTTSYWCEDFDAQRTAGFIQYNSASTNINISPLHDSSPIQGQNFNGVLRMQPSASSFLGLISTENSPVSNTVYYFDGHTVDICVRYYVKDNNAGSFTNYKILFGMLEQATNTFTTADGFFVQLNANSGLIEWASQRSGSSTVDSAGAGSALAKNVWHVLRLKRTDSAIEIYVDNVSTPIATITTNIARYARHYALVFSSSGSSNWANEASILIDLVDKLEIMPSRSIV
jgi:hypothetical protein